MYPQTQAQTTTATQWPIFVQAPRLTNSTKTETVAELKIEAAIRTTTKTEAITEIATEAAELAPISISDMDYEKIAEYITNHCQEEEEEDNYYVCNLDDVDFDLACGGTAELTGDITIVTDYSDQEYEATGYAGQAVKIFAGIDCKAYNEDGDITSSDFDQKRLEKYII